MRLVEWKDDDGWKHLAWVRDSDPDAMAVQGRGISADPVDITELDWGAIKRDLHNQLVNRRLSNFQDVQNQRNGLRGAVLAVLHNRLTTLYKLKEREEIKE